MAGSLDAATRVTGRMAFVDVVVPRGGIGTEQNARRSDMSPS